MPSVIRTIGVDYDYSRVKYLDRGDNTHVYLATDLATPHSKLVAIKVIEKHDPYDLYRPSELLAIQQEFEEQLEIFSRLKHPNILEIFAVYFKDATNRQNLVVREYMRGGTLSNYFYVESERQWHDWAPLGLTQAVARDMTYQIFHALAYMHSLGIAHRALHPDNILLTKSTPPIVKISGLGWAERYEPTNLAQSMFAREPGWADYLAPEVSVPKPPHYTSDARADSWSAGILLFRMLLLKSPWLDHEHECTASRLRWDELDALTRPAGRPACSLRTTLAEDDAVPQSSHDAPPAPSEPKPNPSPLVDATQTASLAADGLTVALSGLPPAEHISLNEDCLTEGVRLAADGPDFLRRLLRDVPLERMSITEALEHPWLKRHPPMHSDVVYPEGKGKARV
ncbi:kinase-like domain-containing protein [Mycena vulgaris]|nr:kinase-like domain-containing protein [Mycena vulgaris]